LSLSSLSKEVKDLFSKDSKISLKIDGFEVRKVQIEMALAVSCAIENEEVLVAEAGTGTGKTFAYLAPAMLAGKKVIISTATKTLQEQLLTKDIPFLLKQCRVQGSARLLKGRENYLCSQRLDIAQTAEQNTKLAWKKLALISDWQQQTIDGDKAELSTIAENDFIWTKVSSRQEFCVPNGCTADKGCFYAKVKEQANEAQILVVNHHLFSADLAMREQGFGSVLPEADIYIFDEAHQLPDIAAQFLGFSISRSQLDELARDIRNAQKAESIESIEIFEQVKLLETSIQKFNLSLGKWDKRWLWEEFSTNESVLKLLTAIKNQLGLLIDMLKPLKERGKQITAIYKKCQDIEGQLNTWLTTDSKNKIRWLESSQARFKLNLTPLSIAEQFNRQKDNLGGSWVFTSATLSVNNDFEYFTNRLGLLDSKNISWESPFDFSSQALIYHPIGLPEPRTQGYIKICMRAVWKLLKATEGHAFLLFTSYKALAEAKQILDEHWQGSVLSQGDSPKNELITKFKNSASPILLGTSSFWEGVDIRGDALKLVMIDRIPFIPPDDPLVQARESALREKGLNSFFNFQVPEATIGLKQGAGRLIRSTKDTGVLVICDPRLLTKQYGRIIVNSLPPFKWVFNSQEAIDFLEENKK
jgi:ATP-dependent DNA helicase DinG